MPPALSPASFLAQLGDLMLIQLANWRWSWRGTVLTGVITPAIGILGPGVFARDAGPEALFYVFSGNLVMALTFETLGKICSNFAYMRFAGMFDYFATLPINRAMLIIASMIAFLLLTIPSLVATAILGTLILGITLAPSPLLLVVVPLAALPLAALGALIGSTVRTPEQAGTYSLLATIALLAIGPVVVPPSRLPDWLQTLGYLSPATYAASALRQTLIGPVTERLGLDLVVLAIASALLLLLVGRGMEWRQR